MKKSELAAKIRSFNNSCNYVRNAYFWGDNENQTSRNYREKRLSDSLSFKYKGDVYECSLDVRMSRKNTYVKISIFKNGVKTTRAVFKKILRELNPEADEN